MDWTERFVLRPVNMSDLDSVYYLATKAGTGMTNLPADKSILKEKIILSERSFNKLAKKPGDESYFFVMEDMKYHKVVGCCGIFASVGDVKPFYSFHVSREKVVHNDLEMRQDNLYLNLVNDYSGVTEIGSLFLLGRYRKNRLGEFLSRARYVFIAQHRKAFHDMVIAEMRGHMNRQGRSPFWHALGKRFIKSSFKTADRLTAAHHNQFIGELLPHTPIPVALLDQAAQACIGKPHDATRGAVRILEAEGFQCSPYVDVFDAGPTYEVKTDHIKSIADLHYLKIAAIQPKVEGDIYLCSNTQATYLSSLGKCMIKGDTVTVTQRLAADLHLTLGDKLALVLF